MIELPGSAKATKLAITYLDIRGNEPGPFEVMFDPDLALIAGQKDILDRFSTGWISYRLWEGKQLAYFSHLISYHCAITKIEYGIETDAPGKVLPLDECDPANPHSVSSGDKTSKIYITIPKDARFMSVRLSYKDGTQSTVKRFDVR